MVYDTLVDHSFLFIGLDDLWYIEATKGKFTVLNQYVSFFFYTKVQ